MGIDPAEPVLDVKDLGVVFRLEDSEIYAVSGVGFSLMPGEVLGVVGESGSGKSVTMLALLGLLPTPPARIVSGRAMMGGRDLLRLGGRELRAVRGGEVGIIFQDPMTSLNPVFTIGYQIMEPLREHLGLGRKEARERAVELLGRVGIPSPRSRLGDFPHQFSGGMRQRVMIAIALAGGPKVLIADEPTTALDVTIQAQIVELIGTLRRDLGMAIAWITHDLGVVAGIADRVMVMYGGLVAERAPVCRLFAAPRHPYTRALLGALPSLTKGRVERLESIGGQPPMMTEFPRACPFAPRCPQVHDRCLAANPPLMRIGDGHEAACWLVEEEALEAGHA
jgi:peptide/nickel transport system ATP-binding protein/oligopeptide transport system ATP-binding protein